MYEKKALHTTAMRKSSHVESFGQLLNRSTNFSLEPFESIVILHL